MAGARDHVELRAADPPRPLAPVADRQQRVALAPDDHRRALDLGQLVAPGVAPAAPRGGERRAEAGIRRGRQRHVDEVGGERRPGRRRCTSARACAAAGARRRPRGSAAPAARPSSAPRIIEIALRRSARVGTMPAASISTRPLHQRRRAQRQLGRHPAAQRAAGDDHLVEPEPLAEALDRARVAGDRDPVRAGRGGAEAGQVDGDHAVRRAPARAASPATPSSCRRARAATAPAGRPRRARRRRAGRGRRRPCRPSSPRRRAPRSACCRSCDRMIACSVNER